MANTLRANYHNRKNLAGLTRVMVQQKFSHHTLMLLDYKISTRQEFLLPPENTPVSVTFGTGPTNTRTSYGYVNHAETITGEDGDAYTRVVALGTSKRMNSVTPASWSGHSRSGITRELATRHRLRSVVHNHPEVAEFWATGNRSDFQCLKALEEETGYRLWVDGATVWLLDPAQIVRSASSMTTPVIRPGDIKTVRVFEGTNIPGDVPATKRLVQYGIDPTTNEVFKSTSGALDLPQEMGMGSISNFREAHGVAKSAARRQRDQQVLKALLTGKAALYPGASVEFAKDKVNTTQGGIWAVSEATHEITTADYTTRLVATRGMEDMMAGRVVNTPRNVSSDERAVVRNGLTWEAVLQERVNV